MASASTQDESLPLFGKYIAFVGKLGAVGKREAGQLVKAHGGLSVDPQDDRLNLVVVGADAPLDEDSDLLDAQLQERAGEGKVEIISETQFWKLLGEIDDLYDSRLYTPSMLADLLDIPVSIIRRWSRRGLIVPAREVHRLPYFSYQEVATARNLAKMLAAGASPRTIERNLAKLASWLPDVERPLAQLTVIVEGRELLLRQGEGLLEVGGQLRFDFEALESSDATETADEPATLQIRPLAPDPQQATPEELHHFAMRLEDEGRLGEAIDACRTALAAGGPRPEVCFQLAELLYRTGDLTAARERYFFVLELDDRYVEARHNLGCLLAELAEPELAAAAFEGALSIHPDYPDAHYHLARTLDDLGRSDEAVGHWRAFLDLAPDSPWADEARDRVRTEC